MRGRAFVLVAFFTAIVFSPHAAIAAVYKGDAHTSFTGALGMVNFALRTEDTDGAAAREGVKEEDLPAEQEIVEQKTAEIKSGTLKITADSIVNVRAEPRADENIVARVMPEDTFAFEDMVDNWYKIVVSEKKTGWILGEYVKVLEE